MTISLSRLILAALCVGSPVLAQAAGQPASPRLRMPPLVEGSLDNGLRVAVCGKERPGLAGPDARASAGGLDFAPPAPEEDAPLECGARPRLWRQPGSGFVALHAALGAGAWAALPESAGASALLSELLPRGENDLAYHVSVSHRPHPGLGLLFVLAQCAPGNYPRVVCAVRETVTDVAARGMQEQDLATARNILLPSRRTSHQTAAVRAMMLATAGLLLLLWPEGIERP
ncbi:MAG: insulinase family protein [Planctomycetota bacterium]